MKNSLSASLADCQSQQDHRKIKIHRVGVKGLRYPIEVRDKNFESQHTVATVSLLVDLPHHFKGTHMSRFVEVLNAHGRMVHVCNVFSIVHELQKKLHAETAHVIMEFPYFIEKIAPVTGSKGLVDYQVRFEAAAYLDETDFVMWVTVPVTTLCPCSKAISDRGAHNQRGYVSVAIRFVQTIWIEDVIEMVEASASSPIYSLLKRPDEKYVTELAFDNPVFVEDLVRNVALRLNANQDILWYRVEAENMESIHNHAAYACVEKELET
ncbi:GTP cyclohydrolase [Methylacidiphilum kamchatkense Kam1]|uniref:GTP cyclohydrolase FolE2 n=1 Tax=Methylacidiphilum kamchatkense Kam1 TaxID=1202785 RepID=A0A0C1RKM3_9BACT|nr:GTP cyclohydrolase FolE2 [Methylacidiphilum kamchatkense]KIE58597.1 GTP cyclohydrolase [Methylacidiphilum kamchatkense Kam1]QDQ41322.1 GTP cyclohydrolase I [Methylacidiphilum kamchatkense Kam1]